MHINMINKGRNLNDTGADPENFSRGGPTLTYNCAQMKITNFFISSNIDDIKLSKFPPLDPRM